jgi:hypothetical protein
MEVSFLSCWLKSGSYFLWRDSRHAVFHKKHIQRHRYRFLNWLILFLQTFKAQDNSAYLEMTQLALPSCWVILLDRNLLGICDPLNRAWRFMALDHGILFFSDVGTRLCRLVLLAILRLLCGQSDLLLWFVELYINQLTEVTGRNILKR